MNITIRIIITGAVSTVLASASINAAGAEPEGQASASEVKTSMPEAVPSETGLTSLLRELPKDANVIIYRAHAEPTIWASTIRIDGKKLAALGNKKWTAARLEPGTHEVKIGWSLVSGQKGGKITFDVVEGETHFLEIVGQSQYVSGYGAGSMIFRMGSGIGEVRGDGAGSRVASCCTFKPPTE